MVRAPRSLPDYDERFNRSAPPGSVTVYAAPCLAPTPGPGPTPLSFAATQERQGVERNLARA